MAGSEAAMEMPFVVSLNYSKADPATRMLIRSHVMRGKKQKKKRMDVTQQNVTGTVKAPRIRLEQAIEMYSPLTLNRTGPDDSCLEFASGIEQSILLNVMKLSTIAMKIVFPLHVAIGLQADSKEWLNLIGTDPAALHLTAFAVEGFADCILRGQESISPTAMMHYEKGTRLLRQRLLSEDDDGDKICDATIACVLKLASATHFNGDYHQSRHHMAGLSRMVDLRGGLEVFQGTYLMVEMARCDLAIAILTGTKPTFFCQPSERPIDYPKNLLPLSVRKRASRDNIELICGMDEDLGKAWTVMSDFCLLVNLGTQSQRRLSTGIIHETMMSVMYRLIDMRFPCDSTAKAVRDGLLAFSYHVFVQWQDIKLPYRHFNINYQNCMLGLESVNSVQPQLMLWLLMVGAISVFDLSRETWLREGLRATADRCQIGGWKAMQDVLKSFMWIPLLDEQTGNGVHDSLYLDKTPVALSENPT